MTDRIPLDAMTSDQLDDLYEQLERAQRVAMQVLDQDEPEPAPAGLREQYAAALGEHVGYRPDAPLIDAVMRVRDRRMEQLANGRATWKAKGEEIERDRDRLAATLREVLSTFIHKTHPGQACLQSSHVPIGIVDRWRTALNPPKEPTP